MLWFKCFESPRRYIGKPKHPGDKSRSASVRRMNKVPADFPFDSRQKLNFAWALVFNVVLIPVAAGAFYASHKIRLPPVWAALAMALSSSS